MNNKKEYSPKEVLGLLIIANENVVNKKFENLIVSLIETISQNNKLTCLENIESRLISKIENYWTLNATEACAYGYLVFNHFQVTQEEITPENITKTFVYQMRLYSPSNAIEFVKRNFGIELIMCE